MIHHAKKSLGQNFLKSESALRKIIEAGEIIQTDIILEIGPGKGALTEKLLEKSGCVIAVEKDKNLFQLLQEKFVKEIEEKKLILIEDDILKHSTSFFFSSLRPSRNTEWDPREQKKEKSYAAALQEDFLSEGVSQAGEPRGSAGLASPNSDPMKEESSSNSNYKIIANIPYNITGAILKKFLGGENQPNMMVLMVQNEVAKRIVARDNKESILSISVKTYGAPKLEMKVPARYFSPAPKVDSAIISIKNISRDFFIENKINEEKFWQLIHAGFAHKRKKLSSNLGKFLSKSSKEVLGNKRAEDMSLGDWILLTKQD